MSPVRSANDGTKAQNTKHAASIEAPKAVQERQANECGQEREEQDDSASVLLEVLPRTAALKDHSLPSRSLIAKKQQWLQLYRPTLPSDTSRKLPRMRSGLATDLSRAIDATLIFAQEEAGTAVCISPKGYVLTCSHCVADDEDVVDKNTNHWLLLSSGQLVRARCVADDLKRDLAILRILAVQSLDGLSKSKTLACDFMETSFPYIDISQAPPIRSAPLICIGQPGAEDLETSTVGVKTGYDIVNVSSGRYQGMHPGQDPQDNSEIGALRHDCWTYWGHSGAPLIDVKTGMLIGLHSSWDDQTGMRRGIGLDALKAFLEQWQHLWI